MCTNHICFHYLRIFKRWYLRLGVRHLVLLFFYTAYLLGGASLFYVLEYDHSFVFRRRWHERIRVERAEFIERKVLPDIFNNSQFLIFVHDDKSGNIFELMTRRMIEYERQLDIRPPISYFEWTFGTSLLFAWSSITTIGYGYIYPLTAAGRVAAMIYSIVGIPFSLMVVKDLAFLIAKFLSYPGRVFARLWTAFRFCTLRSVDESAFERLAAAEHAARAGEARLRAVQRLLNIPTLVVVLALLGWLALGAFTLTTWEQEWSAFTALYFLFNSLTTIGVGDVAPQRPQLLLLAFGYIFVGLAVVSLFINLMHAKFSRAYWLPERLLAEQVSRQQLGGSSALATMASFDSELSLRDLDFGSFVSMGLLQVEDRRPLLGALAADKMLKTAQTQTTVTLPQRRLLQQVDEGARCRLVVPNPRLSTDDVTGLMVERYH